MQVSAERRPDIRRAPHEAGARMIRRAAERMEPILAAFAAVAVRLVPPAITIAPVMDDAPTGQPVRSRRVRAVLAHLSHERMVAFLALVLSVGFYAWYSNRGLTMAYTDAISHMMIARRVVASHSPGIAQLGSVWLPLSHLMMLPFIWVPALFHDGFAGAFPSMISYVLASLYCYKSGYLFSRSAFAGWACALVFMFNINVLYMQSTAMTELPLLASAVIGVYYLAVWARTLEPLSLIWSAAAMMAGTLVRYDAWAMVLASLPVVFFISWRKQGRKAAEANTLLYGLLALAGCAAWFLYNWLIFRNPLYFYDGPYSAKAQQQAIQSVYGLATHGSAWLSLRVYTQAMIDSSSVPLLILAGLGVLLWLYRERTNLQGIALLVSWVPFAFNVLSLYLGISILVTPDVPTVTFGGLPTYFNVRYGMMMIPAIALLAGYLVAQVTLLVAHLRHLAPHHYLVNAGLPMLVLIATLAGGFFAQYPYVLQDPFYGVAAEGSLVASKEGAWLAQHYTGGEILISYNPDAAVVFQSNLPDSAFLTDSDGTIYQAALATPQSHVQYIVLATATGNPIWDALHTRSDWQKYYRLVYGYGGSNLIYERIGSN